jgi:hypothetical protein
MLSFLDPAVEWKKHRLHQPIFFSFLFFSAFYTFCDANVSLKRAKGVTMQQDETKASLALSSCSPER